MATRPFCCEAINTSESDNGIETSNYGYYDHSSTDTQQKWEQASFSDERNGVYSNGPPECEPNDFRSLRHSRRTSPQEGRTRYEVWSGSSWINLGSSTRAAIETLRFIDELELRIRSNGFESFGAEQPPVRNTETARRYPARKRRMHFSGYREDSETSVDDSSVEDEQVTIPDSLPASPPMQLSGDKLWHNLFLKKPEEPTSSSRSGGSAGCDSSKGKSPKISQPEHIQQAPLSTVVETASKKPGQTSNVDANQLHKEATPTAKCLRYRYASLWPETRCGPTLPETQAPSCYSGQSTSGSFASQFAETEKLRAMANQHAEGTQGKSRLGSPMVVSSEQYMGRPRVTIPREMSVSQRHIPEVDMTTSIYMGNLPFTNFQGSYFHQTPCPIVQYNPLAHPASAQNINQSWDTYQNPNQTPNQPWTPEPWIRPEPSSPPEREIRFNLRPEIPRPLPREKWQDELEIRPLRDWEKKAEVKPSVNGNVGFGGNWGGEEKKEDEDENKKTVSDFERECFPSSSSPSPSSTIEAEWEMEDAGDGLSSPFEIIEDFQSDGFEADCEFDGDVDEDEEDLVDGVEWRGL